MYTIDISLHTYYYLLVVLFYLDHFVKTRVPKLTYGIFGDIEYDPSAADHRSP